MVKPRQNGSIRIRCFSCPAVRTQNCEIDSRASRQSALLCSFCRFPFDWTRIQHCSAKEANDRIHKLHRLNTPPMLGVHCRSTSMGCSQGLHPLSQNRFEGPTTQSLGFKLWAQAPLRPLNCKPPQCFEATPQLTAVVIQPT